MTAQRLTPLRSHFLSFTHYIYLPQTKFAKFMFLHVCGILSTGGGVCLSACWDTTPLGADTPPGADPPGTSDPPGSRHPPGSDPPLGPGTPQDQTPPCCAVHAGRYGQQAGGMHPTGMQSRFCLYLKTVLCQHIFNQIIPLYQSTLLSVPKITTQMWEETVSGRNDRN